MRRSLLVLGLVLAYFQLTPAYAQNFGMSQHSVYGALGFTAGGVALGADYEYSVSRGQGIGAYVRMYQKDEDSLNGGARGITTFGAFIRPHFTKKDWEFYVSPGLGIISVDNQGSSNDATTLGGSLAIGLGYELNAKISVGVENMDHHVWLDKKNRGLVMSDLTAKLRVNF